MSSMNGHLANLLTILARYVRTVESREQEQQITGTSKCVTLSRPFDSRPTMLMRGQPSHSTLANHLLEKEVAAMENKASSMPQMIQRNQLSILVRIIIIG